jgi:NADPH2:quinone reductase
MRALVLDDFGSTPEIRELSLPEPAEGEVRVRVSAASVNGFDVMVANSYTKGMMEHRFPLVVGKDFAGTVDAVGPGATDYALGDRVFGVVTKPYLCDGSFGEYVTVPTAVGLAKLPENVTFVDGSALGLAGTTAVDMLAGAQLKRGQTVLIAGATGGVGIQAVQLAAQAGAHVIATAHASEAKQQLSALGATEIVDYKKDVVAEVLASHPQGIDAVIHLAGDPGALLPVVRKGGRFVSALLFSPEQLQSDVVTIVPIFANPTHETLVRVAANQAQSRTRVLIQQTYPLDKALTAIHDFSKGKLGKLVIVIN